MKFQKGHKMSPEMRLKISNSLKGIKRDTNTRRKMSVAQKLNASKFTKEHRAKQAETMRGRKASLETRLKMSAAQSGEKGNKWAGGITDLYLKIRHLFEYRQWVSDIFYRDNFICQECFSRGGRLNAHHIKAFSEIIREYHIDSVEKALNCSELWNLNNGITLCKKCHILIHKKRCK